MTAQTDLTHELLLERIHKRLAGWKINLLSLSGRVVLIKAVLMSLPVYFMSIAVLPTKTVFQIEKVMRQFLWGKIGKNRYLSMIAWKKVCAPLDEGGLGLRELQDFNQALILKVVWQLVSNKDKLWVHIMRAKYYPRAGIWAVQRKTGVSRLWRAVQEAKEFFRESIKWHVGDGTGILATNHPWYTGWHIQRISTNLQRDYTVAQLYNAFQDDWDEDQISLLLGDEAVHLIKESARKPTQVPLISDRLIWCASKKGAYTVGEGYEQLRKEKNVPVAYAAQTLIKE